MSTITIQGFKTPEGKAIYDYNSLDNKPGLVFNIDEEGYVSAFLIETGQDSDTSSATTNYQTTDYAVSEDNVEIPSSWSASIPDAKNKYLWTRITTTINNEQRHSYFVNTQTSTPAPQMFIKTLNIGTEWSDNSETFSYEQNLDIIVNKDCKIDLQPDDNFLKTMEERGISSVRVENRDGKVYVICRGNSFVDPIEVQATFTNTLSFENVKFENTETEEQQ